jgi:hypothetical protein
MEPAGTLAVSAGNYGCFSWREASYERYTSMLYSLLAPPSTAKIPTITGRNLAHAHRSITERAFIAADLYFDRIKLAEPTVKQSAVIVGVCVPYAAAAIAITGDPAARAAVLAGELTLLEAARAGRRESLADHIKRSTPEELKEAGAKVGINMVFDTMVSPNI